MTWPTPVAQSATRPTSEYREVGPVLRRGTNSWLPSQCLMPADSCGSESRGMVPSFGSFYYLRFELHDAYVDEYFPFSPDLLSFITLNHIEHKIGRADR